MRSCVKTHIMMKNKTESQVNDNENFFWEKNALLRKILCMSLMTIPHAVYTSHNYKEFPLQTVH